MTDLAGFRRAAAWDPRFCDRSPLFWPLDRAARALAGFAEWPDVAAYARAFEPGEPGAVRFEPAVPTPRRRRRAPRVDPAALYDARITREGCVPTRARNWHDLLNALVWAALPRSKAALHARQHRAIAARIDPGDRRLPAARTRELDTLAMLDEGGVLALTPEGESRVVALVFGHALYEHLLVGDAGVRARVVPLVLARAPTDPHAALAAADAAFAAALATPGTFTDPHALPHAALADLAVPDWVAPAHGG